MRVINKRNEREEEKKSWLQKIQQIREEAERAREAAIVPEIKVFTDWRIEQEYNNAMSNYVIFAHQVEEVRSNFLKDAIDNRSNLKELVLEAYEPDEYNPTIITIEVDNEIIDTLKKEARRLSIGYDEYIRAIFYTTAFEKNKKKQEAKVKQSEKEKEAWLFEFNGHINQQLRRKLEEKYGKQQHFSIPGFSAISYGYGDMLIDLANEYFGINGDNKNK